MGFDCAHTQHQLGCDGFIAQPLEQQGVDSHFGWAEAETGHDFGECRSEQAFPGCRDLSFRCG